MGGRMGDEESPVTATEVMLHQEREDARLVRVLVGPYQEVYLNNPWFKLSIESFAQFLPVLVDGLAAQAKIVSDDLEAATRYLENRPGPGVQPPQKAGEEKELGRG